MIMCTVSQTATKAALAVCSMLTFLEDILCVTSDFNVCRTFRLAPKVESFIIKQKKQNKKGLAALQAHFFKKSPFGNL